MKQADAQRDRDLHVNGARAAELHAWDIPCGWIVVTPIECQALLQDVDTAISSTHFATCPQGPAWRRPATGKG
jgi:hypothetical protein